MFRTYFASLLKFSSLLVLLALIIISLLIWFFAASISISGFVPFESAAVRIYVIIGLFALFFLVSLLRHILARRANARLINSMLANDELGLHGRRHVVRRDRTDPRTLRSRLEDLAGKPARWTQAPQLPLRIALVHRHRTARHRQDDGFPQFRPGVPARRGRPGRCPRRRRYPQLRLVDHQRRGADRHRRALHHPGHQPGH